MYIGDLRAGARVITKRQTGGLLVTAEWLLLWPVSTHDTCVASSRKRSYRGRGRCNRKLAYQLGLHPRRAADAQPGSGAAPSSPEESRCGDLTLTRADGPSIGAGRRVPAAGWHRHRCPVKWRPAGTRIAKDHQVSPNAGSVPAPNSLTRRTNRSEPALGASRLLLICPTHEPRAGRGLPRDPHVL